MTSSMYFFKLTPVAKPRMTRSDKWNTRSVVANYWLYRDMLRVEAQKQSFRIAGSIDVLFFLPMPATWSKKKQMELKGMPHTQTPDTDNLLKGFCDALLIDDAMVWSQKGSKFWWDYGAILVRENTQDVYRVKLDDVLATTHDWADN